MQITNQIKDVQEKIEELEKIKNILLLINFFDQTQKLLKKLGISKMMVCRFSGVGWDANFNLHYSYSIDKNGKKKDFSPKVTDAFKKHDIEFNSDHKEIKNIINFNRDQKEVFVTLNMNVDEFVLSFAHDNYKQVYTQWKSSQLKERLEEAILITPSNSNIPNTSKKSIKI